MGYYKKMKFRYGAYRVKRSNRRVYKKFYGKKAYRSARKKYSRRWF